MESGHLVTDTSTPATAFTGKGGMCGTFLSLISKPTSAMALLIFRSKSPGCTKGCTCEFSDLYFEKARVCNVRNGPRGRRHKRHYSATGKDSPLQL